MKRLKKEYPLLASKILQIWIPAFAGMTLLLSCAHIPKETREKPTYILTSPTPVLKKHLEKTKYLKNIIGEGKIRIKSSHKKFVFDFLLAVKKPFSVRLESSHSLGGTLGILVTNPKEFLYYDIEQKTLYKGKDRIHILPNIFPYELTTKEIVGSITHSFPLPEVIKNELFSYDEKENVYKMTFEGNEKKWQVLFDPNNYSILEINIEDLKTSTSTLIQYSNFEKLKSNFYFPKTVKLFSPSTKMNFELTFDKVEFPQKISQDFFHLSVPKSVITVQN